jgi:signal transduction histidine kinase
MTNFTQDPSDGNGARRASKRAESQATLSAIGDVSVAATEAVGRVTAAPGRTRWLAIPAFLLLVYIVGSLSALYLHQSAPWVQVFVAPLPVVLIAVLAFWRGQVWKGRARDWQFKNKVQQNALDSLAHETANGLNALRANLAGFEDAESLPMGGEHLRQLQRAMERIKTALEKAVAPPGSRTGSSPPKSKPA